MAMHEREITFFFIPDCIKGRAGTDNNLTESIAPSGSADAAFGQAGLHEWKRFSTMKKTAPSHATMASEGLLRHAQAQILVPRRGGH